MPCRAVAWWRPHRGERRPASALPPPRGSEAESRRSGEWVRVRLERVSGGEQRLTLRRPCPRQRRGLLAESAGCAAFCRWVVAARGDAGDMGILVRKRGGLWVRRHRHRHRGPAAQRVVATGARGIGIGIGIKVSAVQRCRRHPNRDEQRAASALLLVVSRWRSTMVLFD